MRNKRRVTVTIHHRDKLSTRENRTRLGLSAYHWGIRTQPKNPKKIQHSRAYDVSDGARPGPDPQIQQDPNPNHDWHFRVRSDSGDSPSLSSGDQGRLLGRVMIGKVPNDVKDADVEEILKNVPLPAKDTEQNCVSWTSAAIQALQKEKLAEEFDVDQFMAKVVELADEWLRDPGPDKFYNYVDRAD